MAKKKKTARRSGSVRKKAKRTAAVRAWIAQELREQDERYQKIYAEMEDLAPQREDWIQAFFERIQTRGFSLHAGIRRKVKPEELPKRPKRKLRVVF